MSFPICLEEAHLLFAFFFWLIPRIRWRTGGIFGETLFARAVAFLDNLRFVGFRKSRLVFDKAAGFLVVLRAVGRDKDFIGARERRGRKNSHQNPKHHEPLNHRISSFTFSLAAISLYIFKDARNKRQETRRKKQEAKINMFANSLLKNSTLRLLRYIVQINLYVPVYRGTRNPWRNPAIPSSLHRNR